MYLLLILFVFLLLLYLNQKSNTTENFYSFDFPFWQYGRNYYGGYSSDPDGHFYGRYWNYGGYNGYPYYFGYTEHPQEHQQDLRIV